MGRGWSDREIALLVDAYFALLVSKRCTARLRQRTIDVLRERELARRPQKRIEGKLANISQVLKQHGCEFVRHYKPKMYVQRALRERVAAEFLRPLQERGVAPETAQWQKAQLRCASKPAQRWERYLVDAERRRRERRQRQHAVRRKAQEEREERRAIAAASKTPTPVPLRMRDPATEPTPDNQELDTRVAELMTRGQLQRPTGNPSPAQTIGGRTIYQRLATVVVWTRQQARGKCELCGADAPFIGRDGAPYLEVHHVRSLADGGPDTPENVAALCPNCHRKVHVAENADDVRAALAAIVAKRERVGRRRRGRG